MSSLCLDRPAVLQIRTEIEFGELNFVRISTQMWEEIVQSKEIKGWFHYFSVFLFFLRKKINTNKFFDNVVKNCIKVAKEMISNIFKKKLFLMKLTVIKLSNSFAVFIAWKCPIYAHRRVFFLRNAYHMHTVFLLYWKCNMKIGQFIWTIFQSFQFYMKIGIIYFPTCSVLGPSLYVNLNYCSVYVGGPIIS